MDLKGRVGELMPQARSELAELVAIPSVADPRQFPPEECARAAQWVLDAFAGVGFADARLAETPDGSMAVVGSRPSSIPCSNRLAVRALRRTAAPRDDAWRTPPFELTEVTVAGSAAARRTARATS